MNTIKIVVALICAYGLFVSFAYLFMRLLFPRIQVDEEGETIRPVRAKALRKIHRPLKKQKNLAY